MRSCKHVSILESLFHKIDGDSGVPHATSASQALAHIATVRPRMLDSLAEHPV